MSDPAHLVIAGLDPAIHLSLQNKMDARIKSGHDEETYYEPSR